MSVLESFVYFGMPVSAPSTPALSAIVDRLSLLLWVQLPVAIVAFVIGYFQADLDSAYRKELVIGIGLFTLVICTYLTWQYHGWINALLARPVRLTLGQTGRQLHGFMNVLLFFGTIALLGVMFRLIALPFAGELANARTASTLIVQMFETALMLIGAAAAKAWFGQGYTTQTLKQRPRLLWSLRGYALAIFVQLVINVVATVVGQPSGLDWVGLLLNMATNALFISVILYTTRLVQATFGADPQNSLASYEPGSRT